MLQSIPAERARRRFRDFIPLAWPIAEPGRGFLPNWHIDLIADHLQAVAEGRIRRLLITMPPGHAKSLLVSVLWPAWLWVRDPRRRGLFTAYDGDLATRDSLRCRSVLASDWYQETTSGAAACGVRGVLVLAWSRFGCIWPAAIKRWG
jgi:hypothetical protein